MISLHGSTSLEKVFSVNKDCLEQNVKNVAIIAKSIELFATVCCQY